MAHSERWIRRDNGASDYPQGRRTVSAILLGVALALSALSATAQTTTQISGQTGWLGAGNYIGPNDLHPDFAAALHKMGGRMTSATLANVVIAGTVKDANGSRQATITVQAPGYLRYEESGAARVLTFNGTAFNSKSGSLTAADTQTVESLLASFPDTVFLQLARQGLLRRVGSGFRTDNGKTPNYSGPWRTLYAFSPKAWQGLSTGQPLQQEILVAIDEQSGLLGEVRVVENSGTASQKVIQTQYTGWFQQSDQWYPGGIVRLENGQQVLSFQSQQASAGQQASFSSITQP